MSRLPRWSANDRFRPKAVIHSGMNISANPQLT
jgi:hypothetical protein